VIALALVVSVAFPARLDSAASVHAAARSAHEIADRVVAERLEVGADEIGEMRAACGGAARSELAADVRAEALVCAADLGEPAAPFASDGSPVVRAAAIALLAPFPDEATRLRLLAAVADPDAGVAAAALGALCVDDPRRTLREVAAARLRALATDRTIDPGHAAQIARCRR
jgi:hypothetical protein